MTSYSWIGTQRSRWPVVPIRKVCRLGTGHTPDRGEAEYWREEDCVVPWVTVADIHRLPGLGLGAVEDTGQHISDVGLANSAAVMHPAGTVMVSRTASIGFTCRIGKPMATTQAFATWTPGPSVDSRYLLLVAKALAPEFSRLAYGSTHLTIYMPDIESISMPLPPLAAQRAIADYLERETARIDALITARGRMAELLEERWRRMLDDAIWISAAPQIALRRVVQFIDYRGATPAKQSQGVPLVTAGHVRDGVIDYSTDPQFIAESLYSDWMRRGLPEVGDVLMTTEAPLGQVAQIDDSSVALAQRVILLKAAQHLLPDFLALALRSMRFQEHLNAYATGSTALGIKADRLKALAIPVPTVDEQSNVVRTMAKIDAVRTRLTDAVTRQIAVLTERRSALITGVVTGDVQVSEAA